MRASKTQLIPCQTTAGNAVRGSSKIRPSTPTPATMFSDDSSFKVGVKMLGGLRSTKPRCSFDEKPPEKASIAVRISSRRRRAAQSLFRSSQASSPPLKASELAGEQNPQGPTSKNGRIRRKSSPDHRRRRPPLQHKTTRRLATGKAKRHVVQMGFKKKNKKGKEGHNCRKFENKKK